MLYAHIDLSSALLLNELFHVTDTFLLQFGKTLPYSPLAILRGAFVICQSCFSPVFSFLLSWFLHLTGWDSSLLERIARLIEYIWCLQATMLSPVARPI